MAAARWIIAGRRKCRGALSQKASSALRPPGEIHTYEFTVKELGANGAPLATMTVRRKLPE